MQNWSRLYLLIRGKNYMFNALNQFDMHVLYSYLAVYCSSLVFRYLLVMPNISIVIYQNTKVIIYPSKWSLTAVN